MGTKDNLKIQLKNINKNENIKINEKGITLLALIVTIIVLLILAGITIGAITGDNGIIGKAINSKEQSEIANEKEIVDTSVVQAMGKNKYGNLEKGEFNESLNKNAGENKTKLYSDDNEYIVLFVDSNRIYNVDKDGNIQIADESILKEDTTPGEFDGSGTEKDPYIIMSIEDLVFLSQETNKGNTYQWSYIQLGRDLNFNFELSYNDYTTKEFNEFLGVDANLNLMDALTKKELKGFLPIGRFSGNFDGNNKKIKNLYINNDGRKCRIFL